MCSKDPGPPGVHPWVHKHALSLLSPLQEHGQKLNKSKEQSLCYSEVIWGRGRAGKGVWCWEPSPAAVGWEPVTSRWMGTHGHPPMDSCLHCLVSQKKKERCVPKLNASPSNSERAADPRCPPPQTQLTTDTMPDQKTFVDQKAAGSWHRAARILPAVPIVLLKLLL